MRATAYSTVNGKRSEASCSSFSDPSIPLFSGCNNHALERHWGIRASLRKLCCHFSHVKSPRRCGTLLRKVPRWAYPIFFIAAALAAICVVNLVAMANGDHHLIAEQEERAEWRAWEASLAVVVAHAAPLTVLDGSQLRAQEAGLGSAALVRRTQLPSWTLHVVEAECAECLDSAMHAAAVRRQMAGAPAAEKRGATVFATPSAPLGLAGPMLFAMASVTDDVAVGAELARWSWVPRSYAMRRQFAGASPAGLRGGTSPYLVVMGIPSTDQPVRSSLRDAQRDTWLAYTEVARSGNDFRGALLPLYIFAAAERVQLQGVTDVSPLLPTVAEYEAASAMQLRRGGAAETAVRSYSERRVELISGAGTVGAGDARLAESPCLKIDSQRVSPDADTDDTWLSQLASALDLPIMPAAVAPAEFICGASTALWQEALAHRNALWVDMVTDRRPTTKKKLGEGGNWGLPVEVGMSQKLILWLEYAYHAFPDVPYIMKGDDDTYLKVPQFLNDVRYIQRGRSGRALSELTRSDGGSAALGRRELKSGGLSVLGQSLAKYRV
ncbi:phosphoglycan beta 1 3 galactosyltransferase 5 (SCG5) [Lotmaria passim]